MEKISDVSITPYNQSKYAKPIRMQYSQNGIKKSWDFLKSVRSVCIVIFNVTRKVLVFVRQFRPAVYCNSLSDEDKKDNVSVGKYPGTLGITLELCAGAEDKNKKLIEIAQDEILEECGYQVPLANLQEVTTYMSGIGVRGNQQTLFYAEVTDEMRVSSGGGLPSEGELIEVMEMTIEEAQLYLKQKEVMSGIKDVFGILWFLHNKKAQYT